MKQLLLFLFLTTLKSSALWAGGLNFYFLTFEGCPPCKVMLEKVFTDPEIESRIQSDYDFRILDRDKPEDSIEFNLYNKGSFPLMVFTDEEGNLIHQHAGSLGIKGMKNLLNEIDAGLTLKNLKEAYQKDELKNRADLWSFLNALKYSLEIDSDLVLGVWEKWKLADQSDGLDDLRFITKWMMLPGMEFPWNFDEQPIQYLLDHYEEATQVCPDSLLNGRLAFLMVLESMADESTFEPKSFRKGMKWLGENLEGTEIVVYNDSGNVVSYVDFIIPFEALAINFSIWTGDLEFAKDYLPALLDKLRKEPEVFSAYLEFIMAEEFLPDEISDRLFSAWRGLAKQSQDAHHHLLAAELALMRQEIFIAGAFLESGLNLADKSDKVYEEIENLLSELRD